MERADAIIKEVRCWDVSGITLRVKRNEEGKPIIEGYAAVFNSDSENLGGFIEQIKPGAFKNALTRSDCVALFNHDSNYPLGRQTAGTLRLKEDKTGLYMEIDPPDTQYARDLIVSIERKDVKGQSFGFTVTSDTWEDTDKEVARRTINEVGILYDVGPVVYPAYPETDVAFALRSLDHMRNNPPATRGNNQAATSHAINTLRLLKLKRRF